MSENAFGPCPDYSPEPEKKAVEETTNLFDYFASQVFMAKQQKAFNAFIANHPGLIEGDNAEAIPPHRTPKKLRLMFQPHGGGFRCFDQADGREITNVMLLNDKEVAVISLRRGSTAQVTITIGVSREDMELLLIAPEEDDA